MRRTVSGLAMAALLAFVVAAPVSATTTIGGGNAARSRSTLDTRSSFVVVDTNNPIDGSGVLTSWTFYAAATLPVQLDIVRLVGSSYIVVGQSGLVTTAAIGLNTLPLSPGLAVQAGDFVGLYFGNTGTVPFDYTGTAAVYTASVASAPAVGSALTVDGYSNRTYSVNVTGYAFTKRTGQMAPALIPAVQMFPGSVYDNAFQIPGATGKVNWIQPKGNVDINLGIGTDGLDPSSQYTVYLDTDGIYPGMVSTAGPWQQIGTYWTDAAGHGDFSYSLPGGTLAPGNYNWSVFINGPSGYTVLISYNVSFTVPTP